MNRTIHVALGERGYDVELRCAADGFGAFMRRALRTERRVATLFVTDAAVEPLAGSYLKELERADFDVRVARVPSGEASKSLGTASALYDELISLRADRTSVVVAFGGGMVGDLAGFVAATFMRGLRLFMLPTTLLAQVDSSIGGKVAVNHHHKNLIGAFHQPVGVWVDTSVLAHLRAREYGSGLGEVVRYAATLSRPLFERLEQSADDLIARAPRALLPVIEECCRLKADIVAADERDETGDRARLNAGHTIGHALESACSFDGRLLHGEAVAIGLLAESRMAERVGLLEPGCVERLERLVRRMRLPTRGPGLELATLRAAMDHDKKNVGRRPCFALMTALGESTIVHEVPGDVIDRALREVAQP